ncbi:N-acetyl-1-D-myo-inositol-2-amino-2-deoxy-alpha-D-glucopyranoside deacetylase [Kineococcus sp. NUM-3379]
MDHLDSPRRLLLVHAHPDDETIGNGATMARYAASGASVTLVTCTRGELGEIIPAELAHLDADALGLHRVQELATAMEALGVRDHRFLAGPDGSGYRDSGMVWAEPGRAAAGPDVDPRSLVAADPEQVAAELARVIREVRPQVVVTYEPGGGYGHPDHVRTHEVTHRAVELAAADEGTGHAAWEVAKVYWTVQADSEHRADLERLRAAGVEGVPDPAGPQHSAVRPDGEVTTTVDARAFAAAKAAALRAHATQALVEDDGRGAVFRLSNGMAQPLVAVEHYHLARGVPAGPFDARGRESDLFAGIARPDGVDPAG